MKRRDFFAKLLAAPLAWWAWVRADDILLARKSAAMTNGWEMHGAVFGPDGTQTFYSPLVEQ